MVSVEKFRELFWESDEFYNRIAEASGLPSSLLFSERNLRAVGNQQKTLYSEANDKFGGGAFEKSRVRYRRFFFGKRKNEETFTYRKRKTIRYR